MPIDAITVAVTVAVTAAREFADALEAAQAALNAPADPTEVKVGDVAASSAEALVLLARLPESEEPAEPLADWERELLACVALKVGDTVRITGLSIYNSDRIGETGTVKRVDSDSYIVVAARGGWETRVFPRASLELVTRPAPTPDPLKVRITTADDPSRTLSTEPGYSGDGSAYINIRTDNNGYAAAWLSRDEARQLAATLTAIADS